MGSVARPALQGVIVITSNDKKRSEYFKSRSVRVGSTSRASFKIIATNLAAVGWSKGVGKNGGTNLGG